MSKISVIMPAYNAEEYIKEAIDSILNQTFTDFEFIIIDDCSTDSTAEIIKAYTDERIKYYKNEKNLGVAETLNRGLDLATGDYIARMDSDDISLPKRFEKQVKFMGKHRDVSVLGTSIEFFGAMSGVRFFSGTHEELKVDLLFDCCFAHPSVMIRRETLVKEGYRYDNAFNKMEDYNLWTEVVKRYKLATIKDVLLKYRIHKGQVTQQISQEKLVQKERLIKKQLEELNIANDSDSGLFLEYLNGKFNANSDSILKLNNFFRKVKNQNKLLNIYDSKILNDNFHAILNNLLNKLPLENALEIAPECGINRVKYRFNRKIRNALSKVKTYIYIRFSKEKKNLKCKNFTIFSNNCWGGFVYQKYGLKYYSPTVGLFFLGSDFVKFASEWERYISCELQFIPWESTKNYENVKDAAPYPVAKLDDIEVYFMHYKTEQEAAEKWYRRVKRINKKHILFKLSQREGCSKDDIEKFVSLPLEHKVCFSYDKVDGAIWIPELKGFVGDETPVIEKYYDELPMLRKL